MCPKTNKALLKCSPVFRLEAEKNEFAPFARDMEFGARDARRLRSALAEWVDDADAMARYAALRRDPAPSPDAALFLLRYERSHALVHPETQSPV